MRTNRKWFLSLLLYLSLFLGMIQGMTLTARANNNQIGKIFYSEQDNLDLGGDIYYTNEQNNHTKNNIGYLWYNRYINGRHQFGVDVNNGSIFIYISDSDSRRTSAARWPSASGRTLHNVPFHTSHNYSRPHAPHNA